MKPNLLLNSRTADAPFQHFPITDSNYQLPRLPKSGGCACPKLPSFRNISAEYFRNEMRGEFRREVVAFAAIVVTAAVPILSNVHALADFLRAIGQH